MFISLACHLNNFFSFSFKYFYLYFSSFNSFSWRKTALHRSLRWRKCHFIALKGSSLINYCHFFHFFVFCIDSLWSTEYYKIWSRKKCAENISHSTKKKQIETEINVWLTGKFFLTSTTADVCLHFLLYVVFNFFFCFPFCIFCRNPWKYRTSKM